MLNIFFNILNSIKDEFKKIKLDMHKIFMHSKVFKQKYGSVIRFLNYSVKITDGPNFYIQYKDVFLNKIYYFDTNRQSPLIIDGGSNNGISVLYFKQIYPESRIIAFEPDPEVFKILADNVSRNKLLDVRVLNAGLSSKKGKSAFASDRSSGGHITAGVGDLQVQLVQLSEYINEEVDFLKLNIEGAEMEVLQEVESSGKLKNIKEMVVEYHGWAGDRQQMGEILNLLDRNGFRYLVHDFDPETCNTSKPPFSLTSAINWFCLIYAKKNL